MRHTMWRFVALVALGPAGCAPSPAEENVAIAQQEILHGTLDEAETYSGVVYIDFEGLPEPQKGWCSGVMVGPWWVLSASHCFRDGRDLATFNVVPGAQGAPVEQQRTHSLALSGPVLRRVGDEVVDSSDTNLTAQDMALFRLDAPMPRSLARPIHPPYLDPVAECANPIVGTIVGYGAGRSRPATSARRVAG
ncbi:MAG: trypsin-like serine protease [Myxococcales bacterium]|nr:trypsin-like serine protease [Myxococcales bacterium]